MSKKSKTPSKTSPRPWQYGVVAVLSIIAGYMAVYVNFGHLGNGIVMNEGSKSDTGINTGAAQQGTQAQHSQPQKAESPHKGRLVAFVKHSAPKPLPDFKFKDETGAEKTLKDWSGKVVVLNLWATWCAPCREEMPSFDRLKEKLGAEAFDVVAISLDKGGAEAPKEFLQKNAVKQLKFYHAPEGTLNMTLGAVGMPATILIDKSGQEIGRLAGPAEWDSDEAIALVKEALAR